MAMFNIPDDTVAKIGASLDGLSVEELVAKMQETNEELNTVAAQMFRLEAKNNRLKVLNALTMTKITELKAAEYKK